MQDRLVSPAQLAVLRWIAAGAHAGEEPSDTYKTSAVALQGRGLIALRRSPRWTATITDRGSYFLLHGAYPRRSAGISAAESRRVSCDAKPLKRRRVPEVAVVSSLDDPHRVLRAAVRNPAGRLGLSDKQNERCLLIAQTLLREADERGFTIAGGDSMRPRADPGRRPPGTGVLFQLDAGHSPVGIGFSIKHRQVEHVPTAEESARKARLGWSYAPRYDYEPTDVLRIDLFVAGRRDHRIEDGSYPIEDRLHLILARIPLTSQRAVAAEEAALARQVQAVAAAERAREQQRLRSEYDRWLSLLQSQHELWKYHRSLATFVAELRDAADGLQPSEQRDAALAFARWAHELVLATDPVGSGIRPPQTSEVPGLSHAERFSREVLTQPVTPGFGRSTGSMGW